MINFQIPKRTRYLLLTFFTFYFLFTPCPPFGGFTGLFTFPPQAIAADFTTNYNVTYDVSETGKARVTQDITLTNHTANLYPSDYTLTIKGGKIENVSANDELGQMKVELGRTESESTVKVSFNKQAIGQESKSDWILSYDVARFAVKYGRIWEMTVPKITETPDIGVYNVILMIPKGFGPEHFVSPQPSASGGSTKHTETRWIYSFIQSDSSKSCQAVKLPAPSAKPSLGSSCQAVISAAFGDFQLFSFKLLYHLQNPESFAATTEIALPPDLLPYQRIYYQNLEPKPEKIKKDEDGNYLAEYKLSAKEKLDIVFEGMAKINSKLKTQNSKLEPLVNQSRPKDGQPLAEAISNQQLNNLQPYLLPAKYWEVNAPEIQELLEIIKKDATLGAGQKSTTTNYELARAIYNYVVTTLKYDSARINENVERLGAVAALKHKDSAVCMEFTDLLITLMRAAGIPAREIDGYAYTSEDEDKAATSDTLHSWVQIYLPDYGWVNIDPTWGATTGIDYFTKLDTNHLAFVIKGLDSEKPYPAGSYKIEDSEEEDVKISFAEKFANPAIPFRLWWENWERENKKVDWLTALFRFLTRFF